MSKTIDVSKLDPELAAQVAAVLRERDDALGRCKNYQIQAATREQLLLALQQDSDRRNSSSHGHGGHPPDISKAFASLANAGKRLFKKRSGSRAGSIDTGGEPLLATTASATTDASDPDLARSVADAVANGNGGSASGIVTGATGPQSNGGGGGDGSAVTLGYNEMLEQDLRKRESRIQLLELQVQQLRDNAENTTAELKAARSALNEHAQQ